MSNIQWTDISVNPIHLIREDGTHGGHWCHKVSPGCAKCYSETQNQSNYFKFASKLPYTGEAPENLIFDEKVMQELLKMRSPKKVFLCSMTDLFGEWIPDEWLNKAFAYMAIASQHTFQILTKRPERMREYLSDPKTLQRIGTWIAADLKPHYGLVGLNHSVFDKFRLPLPNIWLGTSVENQKAADSRIPSLVMTPAAVRFLSCEPLLESIDLRKYLGICVGCQSCDFTGNHRIGLSRLSWIICGGESGVGARACEVDWIRSLVHQCRQAETPVFVKQFGSNSLLTACYIDGVAFTYQKLKLKDRKGGDISEFPDDLQVREFPELTELT